jgi:hypothetical protein
MQHTAYNLINSANDFFILSLQKEGVYENRGELYNDNLENIKKLIKLCILVFMWSIV